MADIKFQQCIREFIKLWENQLEINWESGTGFHSLSEEGPHLSLLPDEFLPSLDRQLFQLKLCIEKEIDIEEAAHATENVKALVILCRNLDNIPFIASCELVSSCVAIASKFLSHQVQTDCIATVCLFLEALYDPYFCWRKYLGAVKVDSSKIQYQPALLHPEVIPFLYDCFQHYKIDKVTQTVQSLLYLLGAIIKGAQHNAAKALCPATVQLLKKAFVNCHSEPQVVTTILQCNIVMVHTLLDTRPDQCQIEVSEVMEVYQNTLSFLASQDTSDSQLHINRTEIIRQGIETISKFLHHPKRESLQILFARTGVIDFLIMFIFDAKMSLEDKRILVITIIKTIAEIVQDNIQAKEIMSTRSGYQKLFEALKSFGQPTNQIVKALMVMAKSRNQENKEQVIRNVEPITHLIVWLPDIEDQELQVETASAINQLCSSSLQNKALCCQKGLLTVAIASLECHKKLNIRSIQQILRLIQSLGSHSITAAELKLILRLMREAEDGKEFPYSSYILHCLSSMAKKDAACQECHYYFDIQHESEGITVVSIDQWQNPGHGLSVATWLRLDNIDHSNSCSINFRRQLFNLSSPKGHSFEAFFLSDGTLLVAVSCKKEFTTAMVHNVILNDHQWHSICITFSPSRRIFGQSHLSVYIDGTLRSMVNIRIPPVNEGFSTFTIGSPTVSFPISMSNCLQKKSDYQFSPTKTKKSWGVSDTTRLPGSVPTIPNYLSLPASLSSLKSGQEGQNLDPAVRHTPRGSEDSVWGEPTCLQGQIGTFALFQESLTVQNVHTFHNSGPNTTLIWRRSEENDEVMEFYSKVAVCLSARCYHCLMCRDMSPNHQFDGVTKAPICTTWNIKDVLGCIGGVQALFPILETVAQRECINLLSTMENPSSPATVEKPEMDGWEVLPSSSYADWKLEQNPVSGFLSLLRNVLHRHPRNTEQLLEGSNIAIIGSLMQKVHPSLVDVQVLMAVQLLIEFARDFPDQTLLQNVYQYILFDMRIWCRSQFHVRIGHVQYLSNLVREDRHYFRKKYGSQYIVDMVKQHYSNSETTEMSLEDRKTMRQALLDILKMYIYKDLTATDMACILGFLWSVRDNEMITEMLDVLLTYIESKHCRDQFYLLILEPRCAEILYALLLEQIFSTELREKSLRLVINVLKTDKVYEKSKLRLHLHDIGFQGFLCLMQGQTINLEIIHLLTDIILFRDHPNCYSGLLALAYSLAQENLEIKLEFSRRFLTLILSRPNAATTFVKQTSWQECIARLLIRKPITASGNSGVKPMVPELIDLDLEAAVYTSTPTATTPSSPSKLWTSPGSNSISLERDIKDVAESVSNLVAGAVTGNLTNLGNVAEVMADNLQNVAGNIHTNIHSAVNNALGLFRQKTLQVQGSLEELGENTKQHLKRRSQSAQGNHDPNETVVDSANSANSSPRSRHPYKFLVAPLEVAVDALSIDQSDGEATPTRSRDSMLSVSSRGTSLSSSNKNMVDFGPSESLDVESYNVISEVSGRWSGLVLDPTTDPEEDLCSTILTIYLVLLWKGIHGCSKEDWRERSQILSCINLLGLNNELYRSHLEIKRRLIEMILQAAVNKLKQLPPNATSRATVLTNCQYVVRWVYDLVLLDPHEDEAKKMSPKLLELTLNLFDILNVFQDDDIASTKQTEMHHIALGLLARFASSTNAELCSVASARLHALIQSNNEPDVNQVGYLLYSINVGIQAMQGKEVEDCYACLIPIVKTLVEKAGRGLDFEPLPPGLSSQHLSTSFFEDFPRFSQDNTTWKTWMEQQVRPYYDKFRTVHFLSLPEAMNRCWAESDETAMLAVHRRNREVNESKIKFQTQILDAFRNRQSEEHQRYNAMLSHQRGHALLIRKKWRQLKQFLIGPRGSWANRVNSEQRWKLSNCENRSRMRLKMVPNSHFDPHIQASRLRDNTGASVDIHSPDSLNCLLPNVANDALKRALNAYQEPEDTLTEEDLALAASLEKEELGEGKEKVTTSEECELVTLMSVIKGRFEISRGCIWFWDAGLGEDRERIDLKWTLNQLQEVHLRRYNLRRSALEFFLTDQTNYFINFTTKTRNRIFSRILSLRPPNLLYHSSRSPADVLRMSGLTQRWVQREITNFDYLMQLNTIAGRTYNDLSQYPVFPWVLADYQSEKLDLNNPATFRDLSRPIGVVNPKNAKEVQNKFEHFEDPSGTVAKFHYGTHYSNAAGVLHYLVRMEPFTSLHIELQSGRFDVADRQFHSLNSTWRLLMDNPNDVKELIPEFFYLPDFLMNKNRLDLGLLQGSKQRVDDVELPPWAKSAQDFITQHRKALESDYVSAHLHEWIDLIFGFKQRGPAAEEALNVFYYCSYEGAVDLDAIADPIERQAVEGMINHFGQTPSQLFKEPHPARLSPIESLHKSKFPVGCHLFFDKLSCVYVADLVVEPRDRIVYLAIPNVDPQRRGYGYQTVFFPDTLVSLSSMGYIGLHSWTSHDKNLQNGFSLEKDPSLNSSRNRRRLSESFHPSVNLNSRLIAVSSDCKCLYVGGQLDNSIKMYTLPKFRLLSSSTVQHIDIVTCLALDDSGSQLISGSRDTTCIVWDVSSALSGPCLKSVQVLYGHDKPVTCVGLSTSLDMAVSGSLDGTVNVHTIKEGQYIRTVEPPQAGIERSITQLTLSDKGHVIFTAEEKDNFSMHVYTINGEEVGLSYNPFAFTALSITEDYVVAGDSNGEVTIRNIHGLTPVVSMPMRSTVESLVVAPRNTQLVVALKDDRVVVIAPLLPYSLY